MAIEEFAPAKVNLALHVTGQRPDGYHLLDSLVVFADVGDRLTVTPDPQLSLTLSGPLSAGLPVDGDNLVLRAARFLGGPAPLGARITLEKHLPAAAGLGGGSSDAAAALRALAGLWAIPLPAPEATARLGADVPVCLDPRPRRMQGIGEILTEAPPLPEVWAVLANPGVPVSTPAIFRALSRKDGSPMPAVLPVLRDADALAVFLAGLRNDLEPPAVSLAPPIGTVLAALAAQPGCGLARMSGSGATCFGLFATEPAAKTAAAVIAQAEPAWWVRAAGLG